MLFLSFLLMFAGFAALALAMDRHHRDIFGRVPTDAGQRSFRIGGAVLLLLSLTGCILVYGAEFGPVWFVGLAGLAGILILLALAFVPALRRGTAVRADTKGRRTPSAGQPRR